MSEDPIVDGRASARFRVLGPRTRERLDLGSTGLPAGALVDLVIACHDPGRPIGRAVASVLDGNPRAGVTVVCHNLPADAIAAAIPARLRDRIRYLEHSDGLRSPAGPFNAGIRCVRAEWISIMGSDDRLAPGAVDAWLALAAAAEVDVVIPRLALGSPSAHVPTPAPRPSRLLGGLLAALGPNDGPGSALPRALALRLALAGARLSRVELERDRLAYRSAPLGLFSRTARDRIGVDLVEGLGVGEDVAMATSLFAESAVAYDAAGPCYLIGEDAADRVTYVVRPIDDQLAFLGALLDSEWFAALRAEKRRAFGVKAARIHLFGAVHYRPDASWWTAGERESLSRIAARLEAAAPGYAESLSLADRRLLHACLHPEVPASALVRLAETRRRHGRPDTLVTASPLHLLDREAPLRFMAASLASKLVPGASDAWEPGVGR